MKNKQFSLRINKKRTREKFYSVIEWIDEQSEESIDIKDLKKKCASILEILADSTPKRETRVDALLSELNALLTCLDPYSAFDRALNKTRPMLLLEPSLKELWSRARKYNKELERYQTRILPILDHLQKMMCQDPSLISSKTEPMDNESRSAEDELFGDDQWASQARSWVLSQKKEKPDEDWDFFVAALRKRPKISWTSM